MGLHFAENCQLVAKWSTRLLNFSLLIVLHQSSKLASLTNIREEQYNVKVYCPCQDNV